MAKPEWGAKRLCGSCGARFYDLNRDPIACPECGAVFEIEAVMRVKRLRAASRAEPAVKVVDVDEDIEADDEDAALVDDDEADSLIVDDDAEDGAAAPAAATDVDVEEDDALEVDDDVLLEDDEDEAADDLGDLVEDKDDEDLRP